MHRKLMVAFSCDESLGIDWKIPVAEAILSEKDLKHPLLKDYDSPFDYTINLYE